MRTKRERSQAHLVGILWDGQNVATELFIDATDPTNPDPKLAEKAGKLSALMAKAWVFFDGHLDGKVGAS